jgi:hypothetical protein
MSWDIFIQDFGPYDDIKDIPDDFNPQPFGIRDEILQKIIDHYPDIDFSDPEWGIIRTDTYSIELSISKDQNVDSIVLHVRGDKPAADCVANIVKIIGQKAFDTGTGEFLDLDNPDRGFAKFRAYRDKHI